VTAGQSVYFLTDVWIDSEWSSPSSFQTRNTLEKQLTDALLGIAQSSDNPVDKDMESYL